MMIDDDDDDVNDDDDDGGDKDDAVVDDDNYGVDCRISISLLSFSGSNPIVIIMTWWSLSIKTVIIVILSS